MKKSLIVATVVVVALTVWMLTGLFSGGEPPESTVAPSASEERFRVQVTESRSRPVAREVVLAGETEASRAVVLKAEVFGQVEETVAEEGTPLRRGDPILRLETRDRERRVAFLQALIEQRELELRAAERLIGQGLRSEGDLAQARSLLEEAQADLTDAEIDLENTTLSAPFDGVLGERIAEEGDFVNVGQELAHFFELDPAIITAFATERDVGRLHKGEKAHAVLATGDEIEATVRFVAPAAEEQSRTFRVELVFENPRHRVPAGISADIVIETDPVSAHYLSPSVLTLADDGRVGVKIVDGSDTVRFYPVEIVKSDRNGVWLAGLPDKADIITVGMYFTRVGEIVEPVYGEEVDSLSQPEVATEDVAVPTGTGNPERL